MEKVLPNLPLEKHQTKLQLLSNSITINKQVVNMDATIAGINTLLHDSRFQRFSLQTKEGVQNVNYVYTHIIVIHKNQNNK